MNTVFEQGHQAAAEFDADCTMGLTLIRKALTNLTNGKRAGRGILPYKAGLITLIPIRNNSSLFTTTLQTQLTKICFTKQPNQW